MQAHLARVGENLRPILTEGFAAERDTRRAGSKTPHDAQGMKQESIRIGVNRAVQGIVRFLPTNTGEQALPQPGDDAGQGINCLLYTSPSPRDS